MAREPPGKAHTIRYNYQPQIGEKGIFMRSQNTKFKRFLTMFLAFALVLGNVSSAFALSMKTTSWDKINHAFAVPAKYANTLMPTSKSESIPFGSFATYSEQAKLMDRLEDNAGGPGSGRFWDSERTGKRTYGTLYYAFEWDKMDELSGVKVTNLRIWSEAEKDYIDVDMKMTIASGIPIYNKHYVDGGVHHQIPVVFIGKSAIGTPNVATNSFSQLNIRYEFFKAGTNQHVNISQNITYGDIDLGQYVHFNTGADIEYMCTSEGSRIHYKQEEGKGNKFYSDDIADFQLDPKDCVGLYYTADDYIVNFGNDNTSNRDHFALFTVNNYVMADVEPNSPIKRVTDADENRVKANTLDIADEVFEYEIDHAVADDYAKEMYFTTYEIYDTIEDCLTIQHGEGHDPAESIVILQDGAKDVTSKFDIELNGQNLTVKAKDSFINKASFYGHYYRVKFPVRINTADYDTREKLAPWLNDDGTSLTLKNKATMKITTGTGHQYDESGTGNPNNKKLVTNTVKTVVNMPTITKDERNPGIDVEKTVDKRAHKVGDKVKYTVTFEQKNKNATGYKVYVRDTDFPKGMTIDEDSFQVSTEKNNGQATEGFPRDYKIRKVDNGFEFITEYLYYGERVTINFTATVGEILHSKVVPNTVKAGAWGVPISDSTAEIEVEHQKPDKKVSDQDETRVTRNTLDYVPETFRYHIDYVVPTNECGPVEKYNTFEMVDTLEDCLFPQKFGGHDPTESIHVLKDGVDVTDDFEIAIEGQTVKAKAKAATLADDKFYGHKYTLEIDASINTTEYDEPEKLAPWLSENGTLLTIPNKATVNIRTTDGKNTSEETPIVKTVVNMSEETNRPDPSIKIDKFADKHEYQVGEDINYTVKFHQVNQKGRAYKVVIKDDTFPEGMTIDMDSIKVSTEKSNGQLINGFPREYKVQECSTGNGFEFLTEYLDFGENVTIKFTAHADKILHGKDVPNTVTADAWGVPEVKDTETVHITPILPEKHATDNDEDRVKRNTLDTPEEVYTYEVDHTVASNKGVTPVVTFKSYEIVDVLEDCLIPHQGEGHSPKESIHVMQDGAKDVTSQFDVTIDGQTIKAKAKKAFLDDEEFYGHTYTLEMKVVINTADYDTPETLQKWLNEDGTVLDIPNKATVNYTTDDDKEVSEETPTIDTIVNMPEESNDPDSPGIKIHKEADRYEYQIGDAINYTITFEQTNKYATAYKVHIKDNDFPKGMKIDMDSFRISTEKNNGQQIKDFPRDYDLREVDNGFEFITKYLKYGEKVTMTFTAHCDRTLNGQIVPNTVKASAWGVPTREDTEEIYNNSPKMDVTKTVVKNKLDVDHTINYQIVLKQINPGTFMRGVWLDDIMKTPGATVSRGSIAVTDMEHHALVLGTDYDITFDGNSYHMTFAKNNFGYFNNPTIPAEGEAYENLDLQKGYIITYTATIDDEQLEGGVVKNTATAPATPNTNGDVIKDDPEIPSGGGSDTVDVHVNKPTPQLNITKQADKRLYKVGDVGHYTVKVRQVNDKVTAENVVVKDKFQSEGMAIDKASIKVEYNGKNITGQCKIDISESSERNLDINGYRIETGQNLTNADELVVTYDVKFKSASLTGTRVRNVAMAKGDNTDVVTIQEEPSTNVGMALSAHKTADPATGTIVKKDQPIEYSIAVTNESDQKREVVLVRDKIPALTEFFKSDDGTVRQIGDDQYFTAQILNMKPHETRMVRFTVLVSQKATEDDVIMNVAQVKEPLADELNKDGSIPVSAWQGNFKDTNKTWHPLAYWTIADEDVVVNNSNPQLDITKTSDRSQYKVGETGRYTLTIRQLTEGISETNVKIADTFNQSGLEVLDKSIKVYLNGNDITKDCGIAAKTLYGFTINTGKDLSDTDVMKVTYDVAFKSNDLINKQTMNVATATGDNSSDTTEHYVTVPGSQTPTDPDDPTNPTDPTKPQLDIMKTSDKSIYSVGDIGKYTLTVRQTVLGQTEYSVVVSDKFASDGMEIVANSLVVRLNGADITNRCDISYDGQNGFKISTGEDLSYKDMLTVDYNVKFTEETLANNKVTNYATAVGDVSKDDVNHDVTMTGSNVSLGVTKTTKQDEFKKGDMIDYTLEAVASDGTVKNVVVGDTVKTQGVKIQNDSIKVDYEGRNITIQCDITTSGDGTGFNINTHQDLKAGEKITVTYQARANTDEKSIVNEASASGDNVDKITGTVDDNNQPTNSDNNGNDGNDGNGNGNGTNNGSNGGNEKVKTQNTIQTGDDFNMGVVALMGGALLILIGAGAYLFLNRKKKDKASKFANKNSRNDD